MKPPPFPCSLVVTHLQCQAHADISRNELVLLQLAGGMEKGEVDARGGMVAGFILMQDVQAKGMILLPSPLIDCETCVCNLQ